MPFHTWQAAMLRHKATSLKCHFSQPVSEPGKNLFEGLCRFSSPLGLALMKLSAVFPHCGKQQLINSHGNEWGQQRG